MESATFAVNVYVPGLVGVPLTVPDVSMVSPGGRVPDADHVNGAVPPSTLSTLAE